jgi:hypothetical protein
MPIPMKWIALAVVALHAAILLAHDSAHVSLGVGLALWQELFIYPVIVAAPVIAALLLSTRFARAGFQLLAASMLGALLFGVYHHYGAVSPDHVAHLPPGDAEGAFRLTALLMAGVESLGVIVGLRGARDAAQNAPETARV